MSNSSNIKKNIADNNIKNLYLQFTDINGKVKYLNLPVEQIDNILNGEIQFDGSFTENSRENNTLDLKLIPDLSTFIILPFKTLNELPTASFICDICHSDGTPFEGCPRSNLKKIINNANSQGYKMMIAPEIEFFMFPQNKQEKPNSINTDTTGYYDLAPSENYEETILNILNALEKIGIKVEASHHEGAPYQHEIDLDFCEILKTADNLIMFKFISKYIANKYGYNLTFMPKPVYGKNGSGLHLNLILTDLNGKNLLCNEYDTKQLSKTAKNIIGSLLKNIKGITAILNPTINSYKRLVKDYEAPIYIAWSIITRSALIRIPSLRGEHTSLELRSGDFAMNPYLAFAVLLQTSLDGIRNDTDAPTPIEKNLFLISANEIKQRKIKSLPRNLFTALEELEKSYVAKIALGEYIYNKFLANKKQEWNQYRKQVTPWELKSYFDV